MIAIVLLSLIVIPVLYFFFYSHHVNRKWPSLGVPQLPASPFFGHSLPVLLRKVIFGQHYVESCAAFPDSPFVGFVDFVKPQLIIKDPKLIEQILVRDFNHFTDHGFPVDEKKDPLNQNLFVMEGNRWRALRNKFSPMFTTGKLRGMTSQMSDISLKMVEYIKTKETKGIFLKDVLSKFAINIIGSCGFGIDPNTLNDEKNEFREMAVDAFSSSPLRMLRQLFLIIFPKLSRKLGISFSIPKIRDYFAAIIHDTMAHRRSTGQIRPDFVQMMLTLKDKGTIEVTSKDPADDYLKSDTQVEEPYELTDDILTGQAFIFLLAGFETTATLLLFACYELAVNPEIQERARKDVLSALSSDSSEISYDDLKKMNYLDNCIKETSRKYPAVPFLLRVCTKDYRVPDSYLTIKKGTNVIIPAFVIHNNPEFYPEPQEFRPERFEEEIPKCTYLPFGDGPRICIAMRFAMTEMRCALARLLRSYKISINTKTQLPMTLKKGFVPVVQPSSPIYFDLTPI